MFIGSNISPNNVIINRRGGVGVQALLEDIIPSTEYDIIVTDSQIQPNLTLTPASGASQAAYNFTLGDTTSVESTDPTFTSGSPDFLAHDGGDYSTLIGPHTAWSETLFKASGGSAFTIGTLFKTPGSFAVVNAFFSNQDVGAPDTGLTIRLLNGIPQLQGRSDSQSNSQWTLGTILSVNTTYYMIVAADFSNDAITITFWINTTTGATSTDATVGTSASLPAVGLKLSARTDNTQILENGFRTYAHNAFNKVLTNTEAGLALTNMRERTGLALI